MPASAALGEPPAATAAPRRTPSRRWELAAIGWPALLAGVLCTIGITGRSLGFDEGATFAIASQHGSALWSAIERDGGNMSGYYGLMHLLIGAFGGSLWVLRLPGVVAAMATAGLVGAITLRLAELDAALRDGADGARRGAAALIAGTLAAISVPLVYWAQTARGYAPMLALVCGGFLAFLGLARDDPGAQRTSSRSAAVAYVVCMTLACYCSFVAVLVVPVQVLVLIRRPAALRRLGLSLVALGVLCLPLVALAVHRGSGQLFWITRPTRKVDTQVLESLTSSGLQPTFHRGPTVYWLMAITLVAMGAFLVQTLWRARRGAPAWPGLLVASWFALPVVVVFVYSLISQPLWQPRNLLTSVPAVAVALGLGLTRPGVPRAIAAVAVVVVVALRAVPLVAGYDFSPEPWRAVAADVARQGRPGDCIAFYPLDGRSAFQYYVARGGAGGLSRAPRAVLPQLGWRRVIPYVEEYVTLSPAQVARRSDGCRRMWLVSSHEGQPDGTPQSRADHARYLALDVALQRRFGRGPIAKLGRASVIQVQLMPGSGS